MLTDDPDNKLLQSLSKEKIDGFLLDKAFDEGDKSAIQIYEYTGKNLVKV